MQRQNNRIKILAVDIINTRAFQYDTIRVLLKIFDIKHHHGLYPLEVDNSIINRRVNANPISYEYYVIITRDSKELKCRRRGDRKDVSDHENIRDLYIDCRVIISCPYFHTTIANSIVMSNR